MTFAERYDQLQREAQLQGGCMKVCNGHDMQRMHICGLPRVTGMYCELHRYGV